MPNLDSVPPVHTARRAPVSADERVIDLIYDAAAEPDLWDGLLTAVADAAGSASGIFVGHRDGCWTEPRFAYFGRLDRDLNLKGSREDFGESPLMPRIGSLGIGEIASSDSIMPLAEAQRTPWYRGMMTPQGIAHCLMTVLVREQGTFGAFFLARGESAGAYSEAEIARLQQLMPHLRRGAQLTCRVGAYAALAQQRTDVLDMLDTGIVLIDETGAAHCINRPAEAAVRDADGLKLRGLSIFASDHDADGRLQSLIAATAAGGAGATLAMPRRDHGEPLLVLVCPLRGRIREQPGQSRQTVALFIRDPRRPYGANLDEILQQFYRLTESELRIATALASGKGVVGTARALHLSENTVKMHTKNVFGKLGLTSQVGLAQFFARFAPPVRLN